MLNVKATPCEKSKAIVLVGEGRLGFSNKFMDDLEEAKPDAFDLFFELVKRLGFVLFLFTLIEEVTRNVGIDF